MKAPALFQGSIHGDEYEGVDAVMAQIERLATTPRGTDAVVDKILDHTIVGLRWSRSTRTGGSWARARTPTAST